MTKKNLVVVGNGMVGHRFLELLLESDHRDDWAITTFCEEPRLAYDRVNLTSFFAGKTAGDLSLVTPHRYEDAGVTVHLGDRVSRIDRQHKQVLSAEGKRIPYDVLVLATGSAPFVPPISGRDAWGCFVYRTIEDLGRIRALGQAGRRRAWSSAAACWASRPPTRCTRMGLETHVVEFAPRLMALQIDDGRRGHPPRASIEALGVSVHTGKNTSRIVSRERPGHRDPASRTAASSPPTWSSSPPASAPRDELARQCGLDVGERGGIVIDERCRTSDPDIFAIGECAHYRGRTYGLVGARATRWPRIAVATAERRRRPASAAST